MLDAKTRHRLEYVLGHQRHCDTFLSKIADPRGRSVLVVGAGAGTEMLWALRQGAREVVGIDILPQDPAALALAIERLGLDDPGRFEILRLDVEDADALGRTFDLVLSNNVFEHVADPAAAFAACARLVRPGGRIAVFTDPLFHSSTGAHLPWEPWEHLWAERPIVDAAGDPIPLNRMRLGDFLEAIRAADLAILSLGVIPDRHLGELPARLAARDFGRGLPLADLGVEGIFVELLKLDRRGPALPAEAVSPTASLFALDQRIASLEGRVSRLFVDTGGGFSYRESVAEPVEPADGPFEIAFEVAALAAGRPVRSLRWDPLESRLCRLCLERLEWEDGAGRRHPVDLAAIRTNGVAAAGGAIAFRSTDPMALLPIAGEVARVTVAGTWEVLDTDEVLTRLHDELDSREGRWSRLYVDTGAGFSEGESLARRVDPDASGFDLRFDLDGFATPRALRWDPTEGRFSTVRIEEALIETRAGGSLPVDLAAARTNGRRGADGAVVFDTLDPSFTFPVPADAIRFAVRGTWRVPATHQRVDELRAELDRVYASRAWRLGRLLTAPARWLRGGR